MLIDILSMVINKADNSLSKRRFSPACIHSNYIRFDLYKVRGIMEVTKEIAQFTRNEGTPW